MRERGRWWVLAAVVCGLGAACTAWPTPSTHPIEWGQRAEQYFTALHEAEGVGFTNLAPFYAPDAHVDYGLLDYDGIGRPQAIQAMRDSAQSPPVSFGGRDPADSAPISVDEPLYVSRDGAVAATRITPVEYIIPATSTYLIGPNGITSQTWTGSLAAAVEYVGLDRAPFDRLAADYIHAWASGDSDAVAKLYGAIALVEDSITGLRLRGADRIGAAAGSPWGEGGLTAAVLREIPQDGGPAIYVNGESTGSGPIDQMVLLLHVQGSEGCPGDVAVALHLDGSTITAEERFHRIDSPLRCWQAPPSGWWDDIPIPDPHSAVRTGTRTFNGLEVAIWNGAPDPSPLLIWALQRFADAGLPAPIPTSVTFLPSGDDPWLTYGFEEGTTAPDLALPFPASEACLDADCTWWPIPAKAAMLHQLAHLYLADPNYPRWEDALTGPTRTEPYRTARGLTWLDPDEPWKAQASQLAAETLVWGLMDQPYRVDQRMGSPSCADLAHDFAVLTGATPDARSCSERAGQPKGGAATPQRSAAAMPEKETSRAAPVAAAQRWFDAYNAALEHGILDLYGYYSPSVAFDHRGLGVNATSGRDALREHLTTMAGAPLLQRAAIGALHLSESGAVEVAALPGSMTAAFVRSLAATGITAETYAPSLVTLRAAHPDDERLNVLDATAEEYVSAWAGQDVEAVADLYSPGARITDDLLDITAAGTDEVRALGRAAPSDGGLPDSLLVALPDLGGPAVFATGDPDPVDPLDTVVLLLSADVACPNHLAVVLRLDADGLIAEEDRYHGAADLGGCHVPMPAAGGWWEEVAIPPGVSVGHSGTLTVADSTLDVRNSSPALDRLIGWGLGRFTDAGLVAPGVHSVTFVDRKAPACGGINGLAAGDAVSLCFGTSDACTDDGCAGWRPWARKALVHELSHLWLAQNVTPGARDTFLRASGLTTWESTDQPWGERGVELAAETMAGELMDEPVTPNVKLTRRYTCDEWAAMYAILTGDEPADLACSG
jgi:hypothetical protein